MIQRTGALRLCRAGALAALAFGLTACESFSPEWVEELDLQPDSLHLAPGETAFITAVPLSQRGSPLPERAGRVEFSISQSASRFVEADVSPGTVEITARELGSVPVRAQLGRGTGTTTVHVVPAGLASIRVEPAALNLSPFTSAVLRAVLLDEQGNELPITGHRVSWKSNDTQVARVSIVNTNLPTTGVFARRAGQTTVTLTVSGRTFSIPVVVN